MFNFHKPRVYRSADGCCICRAKSSSSRFTASRKYEKESMQCFNLEEPRNGEICNACVLLVKRYKRLPVGSKRHWGHVVDARAGPGTKSLAKQKKRDNDSEGKASATNSSSNSFIPEKFAKIFKKNRKGKITATTSENSVTAAEATATSKLSAPAASNRSKSHSPTSEHPSDSNESYDEDQRAQTPPTCESTAAPYQTRKRTAAAALAANNNNSLSGAPRGNRPQRVMATGSKRRRMLPPMKHRRAVDNVPFFEEHDLVRLEVCCGIVFQSLALGSYCYIIDPELYRPCEKHRRLRRHSQDQPQTVAANPITNQTAVLPKPPVVSSVKQAMTTTPALKKHHLYFKRQSESFPQGDINRISPIPLNKTEALSSPLSPTTPSTHMPPHSTKLLATTAQAGLSLILKPTGGSNSSSNNNITTTAIGAASPSSLSSSSNCSTSSSVATKFNDNSSDSGFDEHVLERKSVSPPTQDDLQLERKTRSVAGMQRLILASGLPITGQAQNLVLAGNEFGARFVQQRQQVPPTSPGGAATGNQINGSIVLQKTIASTNSNSSLSSTQNTLKINVLGSQGSISSSAGATVTNATTAAFPAITTNNCNKMRAIFNAANAIQHENGVTTILPACSLAATNQAAAMNAIAPSTVTITPAPGGGVAKKIALSAAAVQQGQALPLPLTISNAANTTTVVANPKFILLKPAAAKFNTNNNNNNLTNTVDAKIA